MLYDMTTFCVCIGAYIAGIVTGIAVIRYGISIGSRMRFKAEQGLSIDDSHVQIEQEFTE